MYLLSPSKEVLKERIGVRLEKRLKHGMVEEVKSIMARGYNSKAMKKFGLEYEIIGKYLEGAITEDEMKQEILQESVHYAKRQTTWNKKYEKLSETNIIRG
jgi:tRNA dimethylallyltransferase